MHVEEKKMKKNSRGYRRLEPGNLTQSYIGSLKDIDIIYCLYSLEGYDTSVYYSGLVYYPVSGRLYHTDDVILDLSSIQ